MKEKIAGRYADILSFMYLGTATLKRFEAEGRRKEDLDFFKWSMDYVFYRIQEAFDGILREIKVPGLSWVFRLAGVWSRLNPIGTYPSDDLGHRVAQAMQEPGATRDRMTDGMYIPTDPNEAVGRYENALNLITQANPIYKKIYVAMKKRELPKDSFLNLLKPALDRNIITKVEAEMVEKAEAARNDAIQVDEFTLDEYMDATPTSPEGKGLETKEVDQLV